MLNSWLSLSFQAAYLGWEAQNVMALRFMRIAGGGDAGRSEGYLMITEKLAAMVEAHSAATILAMKGGKGDTVANAVLKVYQKRVRGNKQRVSK
jgi:hypothetical protein